MKTKKVRPVLAESKRRTHLIINDGILTSINPSHRVQLGEKFKQLILISLDPDEKIEVGDSFVIIPNGKAPIFEPNIEEFTLTCVKLTKKNVCYGDGNYMSDKSICKKVIATQDQIPESYIQQFIEEYNKDEVKDVEIETKIEKKLVEGTFNKGEANEYTDLSDVDVIRPKLTNGLVTTVKKEPIIYTEGEVENLLLNLTYDVHDWCMDIKKQRSKSFNVKKWFEQNKKK